MTATNATPSSQSGDALTPTGSAGVVVYANDKLVFRPTVLTTTTAALTVGLSDLNDDGRLDLLVGNAEPATSQSWLNTEGGWVAATLFVSPLPTTAGFAWDDLNNDGTVELLTTGPQTNNTGAPNKGNPLQERSGLALPAPGGAGPDSLATSRTMVFSTCTSSTA